MSLLDRGQGYVPCIVYPEVTRLDADNNKVTRTSATGIPTVFRVWIMNQSGTSSRRAESNDEGYETEQVYMCQFTRAFEAAHGPFGAQAQVAWGTDSQGREKRFEFFGDAIKYTSSRRTAHTTYTLRRY